MDEQEKHETLPEESLKAEPDLRSAPEKKLDLFESYSSETMIILSDD